MLRSETDANSNSAPDVAANLLVPWQRKVIFELFCCTPADCVKASNRTTQISLIDDKPSLLCQMLSSLVDIISHFVVPAKPPRQRHQHHERRHTHHPRAVPVVRA